MHQSVQQTVRQLIVPRILRKTTRGKLHMPRTTTQVNRSVMNKGMTVIQKTVMNIHTTQTKVMTIVKKVKVKVTVKVLQARG